MWAGVGRGRQFFWGPKEHDSVKSRKKNQRERGGFLTVFKDRRPGTPQNVRKKVKQYTKGEKASISWRKSENV